VPAVGLVEGAPGVPTIDVRGTEGEIFNGLVVTMTETNGTPGGDYTAWIDWGDGTAATTGTVRRAGDEVGVGGQHTYAHQGSYPVHVTIEVDGVTLSRVNGSATVVPAAANSPAPPCPGDREGTPEDESGPTSLRPANGDCYDGGTLGAALCGLILPFWDILETEERKEPSARQGCR
jgi:hypothetical protein